MTRHLEQTFKSAVLTSLYPRSQIDIYVEVLYQFLLHNIFCLLFAFIAKSFTLVGVHIIRDVSL